MKKEKQKSYYSQFKRQNGITLIAHVVTIVVLLILAGITITAVIGDNGLINRAKTAAEKTNQAVQNDITAMEEYNQQLQDLIEEMERSSIKELMTTSSTKNETVYDKYGNKIRMPAGFKILAHGTRKWKSYSRIYL